MITAASEPAPITQRPEPRRKTAGLARASRTRRTAPSGRGATSRTIVAVPSREGCRALTREEPSRARLHPNDRLASACSAAALELADAPGFAADLGQKGSLSHADVVSELLRLVAAGDIGTQLVCGARLTVG